MSRRRRRRAPVPLSGDMAAEEDPCERDDDGGRTAGSGGGGDGGGCNERRHGESSTFDGDGTRAAVARAGVGVLKRRRRSKPGDHRQKKKDWRVNTSTTRRTALDDDGEGSDESYGKGGPRRSGVQRPEQHHRWSVYRRNPVDFCELASVDENFAAAWERLKCRRRSLHRRKRSRPGDPDSSMSSESFSTHVDYEFNASLTRALLRRDFGIEMPSLPRGKLVPPVPQRLNYALWVKELLLQGMATTTSAEMDIDDGEDRSPSPSSSPSSTVRHMNGIDIGTGASCILPLLLHSALSDVRAHSSHSSSSSSSSSEDGAPKGGGNASSEGRREGSWRIFATDVDVSSVNSARLNIAANGHLRDAVHVALVPQTVHESSGGGGFRGPLLTAIAAAEADGEEGTTDFFRCQDPPSFDFVVTNPPFYSTADEASMPRRGDGRDRTDMTTHEGVYNPGNIGDAGGGGGAGGAEGGELAFVLDILRDSLTTRRRVGWYTSMLCRKRTLDAIMGELTSTGFPRGNVRSTEFVQGRQTRWGVAWTYLEVPARSVATVLDGCSRRFQVEIAAQPPAQTTSSTPEFGGPGASSVESVESSAVDEVFSRVRTYTRHHPPRGVALTCTSASPSSSEPSSGDRDHLLRRAPPGETNSEGGGGGRRRRSVVLTITEDRVTPAEAEAGAEPGGKFDGAPTLPAHGTSGGASGNDGGDERGEGRVGDEGRSKNPDRSASSPSSASEVAAASHLLSWSLLPPEGEFLVDVTVDVVGHAAAAVAGTAAAAATAASTSNSATIAASTPTPTPTPTSTSSTCLVNVEVRCHGHTARGCAMSNAFVSGFEGEVRRTNRRWRRMISTEEKKKETTSTMMT